MHWSIVAAGPEEMLHASRFAGRRVTETDGLDGDAASLPGGGGRETEPSGHFSSLTFPWQQEE